MADVTLTAAVRDSLLSLQSTTKLIEQTQGRLSSGLKVRSPIDDPVAYFQGKTLTDRAFDFNEKKDGIDQGVSTVTAALDGVTAIETLVRQMKGVANSMKSATASQLSSLVTQFNDLRNQINYLAADASYQGTNLINGTGTTLSIEFSDQTQSLLSISSVDLTVATGGLNIGQNVVYTTGTLVADYAAKAVNTGFLATGFVTTNTSAALGYYQTAGGNYLTAGDSFSLTWAGPETTVTSGTSLTLTYGTGTLSVTVQSGQTINNGDVISVNVLTAGATATDFYVTTDTTIADTTNFAVITASGGATATTTAGVTVTWNGSDDLRFTTANQYFSTTYGGVSVNLYVGTAYSPTNISAGGTFSAAFLTGYAAGTGAGIYFVYTAAALTSVAGNFTANTVTATDTNYNVVTLATTAGLTANAVNDSYVAVGATTDINSIITSLDSALTTLRTQASTLGSNVATLQTRLDFTETYVNTLESGAGKLTLADINTEGANLLALQTRQQLGINSLAFAGQAEQSILSLFR